MLDGSISVPSQKVVVETECLVARDGGYSRLLLLPDHLHNHALDFLRHFPRSKEKNLRGGASESKVSIPRHEHVI